MQSTAKLSRACLSPTKPQAELEQDISQDEQLHQDKQPLPFAESSTSTVLLGGKEELLEHKRGERSSSSQELSIPCIVKQPKRPGVKGVIRKDEGDRFLVYIPSANSANFISKLFVYPDLDNCSSKTITPSKDCSSTDKLHKGDSVRRMYDKTRRHKGEGSGHIYYHTVTRNGKDYRQAYYQWRENGKRRTKYIPKIIPQLSNAQY